MIGVTGTIETMWLTKIMGIIGSLIYVDFV